MLDTATVAALMETLREQLGVLRDLAEIGEKKTKVLIQANLRDLDILVQGEQALLMHLNRIEGKRIELQHELAVQSGVPPAEMTFTRLVEAADPGQAAMLRQLHASFQVMVEQLSGQQNVNAALIEQALQYVNFNLQVMTGAGAQVKTGTYTAAGQRQGAPSTRLNRKIDGRI